MDDWKTLMKHYYPKKAIFTVLIMKGINDADYTHPNRVCRDFKIKTFGKFFGET